MSFANVTAATMIPEANGAVAPAIAARIKLVSTPPSPPASSSEWNTNTPKSSRTSEVCTPVLYVTEPHQNFFEPESTQIEPSITSNFPQLHTALAEVPVDTRKSSCCNRGHRYELQTLAKSVKDAPSSFRPSSNPFRYPFSHPPVFAMPQRKGRGWFP